MIFLRMRVRLQFKEIIHRMSKILFAAEMAFRRLDGRMAE